VTRHTVESVGLMAIEQVATLRDALVMAEERERQMVVARAIQAAEIERLRGQVAVLREALVPFAKIADATPERMRAGALIWTEQRSGGGAHAVSVGDTRNARAALAATEEK
jgi:hypothetical protein